MEDETVRRTTVPTSIAAPNTASAAADGGAQAPLTPEDLRALQAVENRVLWLATSIIHHANRVRPNPSGLKVGGHQASSASAVTIMTSLWLRHLGPQDRVSVKPHASPVMHALSYLLGDLDERYLTTLREFGGLQSYPSRSKDPVPADYSTGSVGIGPTATIWGAIARRYVNTHGAASGMGRQYCILGDAELDEGAIWEAVIDPMVASLGELVWIVDFNRQSLDRVVPNTSSAKIEGMFAAAGWQVIPVIFGSQLEELFRREGGDRLRARILRMSNSEYQRLIRCDAPELRRRLPGDGADAAEIERLLQGLDDQTLTTAIRALGGHDFGALERAFSAIDDSRPTVILAYTLKGNGLPTSGHPQNHSSLLTIEQYEELAQRLGESTAAPWRRFDEDSPEGRVVARAAQRLRRPEIEPAQLDPVPTDFGRSPSGTATTQAALGRVLMDLARSAPAVAARVTTVSPDVSSSTNLAGWLNKVGVWAPRPGRDWFDDDAETIMHWRESQQGQHLELGIAELNLVGLVSELGATWSRWGSSIVPIGVLYDPFLERALEPWSFGIYAGGQSILVGTPSGVTLAPEGGAHQSIKTPSIGLEQPGCISYEPAFAQDAEWLLLSAIGRVGRPGGSSFYFRLSTRPIRQDLAGLPDDPDLREQRRRHTVAGGYRLRRGRDPQLTIVSMGAMVPEALTAADRLAAVDIGCDVVVVTSPGLLFEATQSRSGVREGDSWIVDQLFPQSRACPMVTVVDGHPHTLSFLASFHGVQARHLGVTDFGQSGSLEDVYRYHGIDASSIVRHGLDLLP